MLLFFFMTFLFASCSCPYHGSLRFFYSTHHQAQSHYNSLLSMHSHNPSRTSYVIPFPHKHLLSSLELYSSHACHDDSWFAFKLSHIYSFYPPFLSPHTFFSAFASRQHALFLTHCFCGPTLRSIQKDSP